MSGSANWLPSLNALRAFSAVARHGSFQAAAEELHVTSPAVQHLVRGLERALGQALVVRRGRQITPTGVGADAAKILEDGFDRLAVAVNVIRAGRPRDEVKVSVEPSFAAWWLMPRLHLFVEENPDVDVLVEATNRIVDLRRNEADVAVRYCAQARNEHRFSQLFEDETVAICSPALALSLEERDPSRRLDGQTLIHFSQPNSNSIQLDWTSWAVLALGSPPSSRLNLRFTDYVMSLQAAIAGQGFALASRPLVQQSLDEGLLACPFAHGVRNGFSYNVLIGDASGNRRSVKAFADWICNEATKCAMHQVPPAKSKMAYE